MLRPVNPIVKHQFAVLAVHIVKEELLIAHGSAIFHVQDQVVTLAFVFSHHLARAVDFHHARLIEENRFRGARSGLREDRSVVA